MLRWLLDFQLSTLRARAFVALALFMTCAIFARPAFAASSSLKIPGGGQVLVDAKYASRDYDKGTLELSGDVIIMYNQQYMSCDRALINEKLRLVEAVGNVVISSPQAYVEGSRAVMNYQNNTGSIENGFVKSGQVIFEGSIVRKTGPATYEAENSKYTACTNCPATWSFNGSKMTAEVGGYASIKYPVMRVGDVPVLWLPYLLVPLKSERQSGFLIPTIEYSGDDGAVLGLRYFWALSRSQDATFTLKSYSRRGEKGVVDYRYVLNDTSHGELNGALIHDSIFPTDAGVPVGQKGTRWFAQYTHTYELPYDITQKTDLNLESDLFYARDFAIETGPRGDPGLENKASATRNTDGTHTSIEADYFINTLKSNPIDSNDDAVHKWPEIRYAVTDRPIMGTHLLFSFNADYTNFVRDRAAYDTVAQAVNPSSDGTSPGYPKQIDANRSGLGLDNNGVPVRIADSAGGFDPRNDIIRTGQRLDLSPTIAYPFSLGQYIDVLPSLQYRHTQYAFNVTPPSELPDGSPASNFNTSPYRAYTFARLSARTHMYRTYGQTSEPEAKAPEPISSATNWVDEESKTADAKPMNVPTRPSVYRHEIIPEIIGTYLPYVNQPGDSPFFAQGAQLPLFLQDEPISNDNFLSAPPPGTSLNYGALAPTGSNIQFDYYDRLTTRTSLTAQITNRLVRKRYHADTSDYTQVASWQLGESYDFTEAASDYSQKLPWSDVYSHLDIQLDRFSMNSLVRYFPYHNVTDSYSYVRLKNETGTNFVELSFTRSYDITRYVSQTTQSTPDSFGLGTGLTSKYVDATASLNFNPPDVLSLDNYPLTSWSTDFRIRPPGNCWVFKIHYDQQFAGPHNIGFDFEYNFGGGATS